MIYLFLNIIYIKKLKDIFFLYLKKEIENGFLKIMIIFKQLNIICLIFNKISKKIHINVFFHNFYLILKNNLAKVYLFHLFKKNLIIEQKIYL